MGRSHGSKKRQGRQKQRSGRFCLQCDAFSVRWVLSKIYESSHSGNCSITKVSRCAIGTPCTWNHSSCASRDYPGEKETWAGSFFSKAARKSSAWPDLFTHLLNQAKLGTKWWKWKLIRDSPGSHTWQFWVFFFFFSLSQLFFLFIFFGWIDDCKKKGGGQKWWKGINPWKQWNSCRDKIRQEGNKSNFSISVRGTQTFPCQDPWIRLSDEVAGASSIHTENKPGASLTVAASYINTVSCASFMSLPEEMKMTQ